MLDVRCSTFNLLTVPTGYSLIQGVSKNQTLNTDLVATEGPHRWQKVQSMSDSDIAGRIRVLTPDTRHLTPVEDPVWSEANKLEFSCAMIQRSPD